MDTAQFFHDTLPKAHELGKLALSMQPDVKRFGKGEDPDNVAGSALTAADIRLQEEYLQHFLAMGYRFRIYAEEDTRFLDQFSTSSDVLVTLDPIDGTLAYQKNVPNFCSVIAVYIQGCLDGAMVHTPTDGKTYAATQGEQRSWVWSLVDGEFVKEEFVHVQKRENVVLTYNPCKIDPDGEQARKLDRLRALGIEVHEFDKVGQFDPEVGLNSILRGEISAYFRTHVPCLDWGPTSFIMEKAGRPVTYFDGQNRDIHRYWGRDDGTEESRLPSIVVSGDSNLHQTLVDVLKR